MVFDACSPLLVVNVLRIVPTCVPVLHKGTESILRTTCATIDRSDVVADEVSNETVPKTDRCDELGVKFGYELLFSEARSQ